MIFSRRQLKKAWQQMSSWEKRRVLRYVIGVNLILFLVVALIGFKIHQMSKVESFYISSRTAETTPTQDELNHIKQKKVVDTKVYLINLRDINVKDKSVTAWIALTLSYNQADFPDKSPDMDIANGVVRYKQVSSKIVKDGIVNEVVMIEADLEPRYLVQLYPLDKQLLYISLTPNDDMDSSYYFKVNGFYDETQKNLRYDYVLAKIGYTNQIESYAMQVGNVSHNVFDMRSRSYMIFDHKNIYTYIKNIQYIILSVLIAIFALLINSKINSPLNGRVAVIGSSVFSLAANAFQINSTVKPINSITLIDLITMFCGFIILLCFWITIRMLRFLDEEGYNVAKVFDTSMYLSLIGYTGLFFVLIYVYV